MKYDLERQEAKTAHTKELDRLSKTYTELMGDMVTDDGVRQRSAKSRRSATKIQDSTIPQEKENLKNILAEISSRELVELNDAKIRNSELRSDKNTRILTGGNLMRGANIVINILRCIIAFGLALYFSISIEEKPSQRVSNAPKPSKKSTTKSDSVSDGFKKTISDILESDNKAMQNEAKMATISNNIRLCPNCQSNMTYERKNKVYCSPKCKNEFNNKKSKTA